MRFDMRQRDDKTSGSAKPTVPISERDEILQGSLIGVAACLIFAWLADAPFLWFEMATIWGACVGALIGLVLWAGSVELPEEEVLPPAPEQERKERPRHRG
ncbi:MAG: hypothetical protein ACM3X0_03330 [Bacteroidota bacterium]